MKLYCEVEKSVAIRAGREQWGKIEIEADLASLTPDQRAWVAEHTDSSVTVAGAEATLAAWQAAVDEIVRQKRDERTRRQAAAHDELAALLAAPMETSQVGLTLSGDRVVETCYGQLLTISYQSQSYYHSHTWDLTPEDKATYDTFSDRVRAENAERKAAAIAAAEPQVRAAAQAQAEAKAKAEAEAEAQAAARWSIETGGKRCNVDDWTIESGCVAVPETDRGGSWLATVAADKAAKSGFRRTFWERGSRGYAQVPGHLQPGDYVENGTKDKKGRNSYTYYRVLGVLPDRITVRSAGEPPINPKSVHPEIEAAASHPACTWPKEETPAASEPNPLSQYSTEQLEAEIERRKATTRTLAA